MIQDNSDKIAHISFEVKKIVAFLKNFKSKIAPHIVRILKYSSKAEIHVHVELKYHIKIWLSLICPDYNPKNMLPCR